jgi:tetratricopeptide (TPR) repeat protein
MDLLVDARNIRQAAQKKPLSVKVGYLIQVLQALAYLHRRGIIHRDLKPANVLVKDERVKVLDFGFATLASQARIGTTGTLAYLTPEVFQQQPASIASDLYAVGVMAYELIVGYHPFDTSNMRVLVHDLVHKIPDLSAIGSANPLGQVIGRLLAKSPEDRYASAQQVIAALSKAIGQAPPTEDRAIRESFLQAAPLIGREIELAALSDALQKARDGNGSSWLIGGESGVGKSRLLAEIATLALIRGALVLRGTAIREGARPFQIWLEPLRRLVLATTVSDSEASILKELIPDIDALLDRPVSNALPLDSPSAQQGRLLTTIIAVFRRQTQPIVAILDDLQWMRDESLALLHQLNTVIEDRPILILADYRDDERIDLPATLPEMQAIKLVRLSRQHIAQLSQAMLGENGRQPEIIAYLERETEGNVFFLIEVVRALAEEAGQLTAIGNKELPAQLVVGGIQRIIERRLTHIPAHALPLLQIAAVLGRKLDLAILAALDPAGDLQNWLVECANAAILDVLNERWQFAHDKLREGILNAVDSAQRRELHTQVAQTIEALHADLSAEAAALAYHWNMAGNDAKEAEYAFLAGKQASQSSAGNDAVKFFKRSLELSNDSHQQAFIMTHVAQSLFWLGEFNESRQYNLNAISVAREYQDQKLIGDATSSLGNTAIHQGEYTLATDYHQESLEIARALHDGEMMSHALSGLGDVAWRTGHYEEAMGYLRENLAVAQQLNRPSLTGNAYNMLGIVYAMQQQFEQAKEAFQQSLNIAQQTGDRSRVAQALSNLGEVTLIGKDYAAAKDYFEQALVLSHEAGNLYSIGNIQSNLGLIALAANKLEEARRYFLQSLRNAYHIDAIPLMLAALGGLARLDAQCGEELQALELAGLVLYHPAGSPDLQNIVTEAMFDEIKPRLPSDVFTRAVERGKTFDVKATAARLLADS